MGNKHPNFTFTKQQTDNSAKLRKQKKRSLKSILLASLIAATSSAHAQVGELIWEDNFDTFDTDVWTPDEGNGCDQGLCGFGNAELQSYEPENVSIQAIAPLDGQSENYALALQAIREDVADQNRGFSSGKITSDNKLSVQYGMIEFRVQVPDLQDGYWPAVWMLGTSTLPWPHKGEIDMMEMGHQFADREEWLPRNTNPDDDHGPAPEMNSFTGANTFHYSLDACNEFNLSCAANGAWQTDNAYASTTPMAERFVIYRTYWTPEYIRFTVEDNGEEQALFQQPLMLSDETSAFREPFFFLMNMAVGGTFTGMPAYSDEQRAEANAMVTAPDGGTMLVDYLRVYQLEGHGSVTEGTGITPEAGTFGVFTDNTPANNKLEAGSTSSIFLWNTDTGSEGTIAPHEGDNVIAWSYDSQNVWFGGGIQTNQARDLSNFDEGELKFSIQIPADVAFRIGVEDTYGNQNWILFPANETAYGLNRNGSWGRATIPMSELRGELIAIQSLEQMFMISSDPENFPSAAFQFAIDDIIYEGGGDVVPPIAPETKRIQAQDYVAYKDTTSGNTGGQCRTDNVDIQSTGDVDGVCNVGWTRVGEWLEYTVELGVGDYDLLTRVATNRDSPAYTISLDGGVIGSDALTNTGGWQSYETRDLGQVSISQAGTYTVRVDITGNNVNLNWLEFNLSGAEEDTNQALNKTSTSSTTALQATSNAFDGDASSRWESQHGVRVVWLKVDLGSEKNLSQVIIDWEAANAATYRIQGSNDNSNWTSLALETGGTFGARTDVVDISGSYRWIRMRANAFSEGNFWGYSIYEMEVLGSD